MAKARTVFGVAVLGDGPHRSTSVAYRTWKNMLARCYDKKNSHYKNYGAKGVTVADEWLNFQNFAEWYNLHFQEGLHLDKDKLGDGSIYSPSTCCFLTRQENVEVTFAKTYTLVSPEGELVTFHNLQKFARSNGLYGSNILKVLNGQYKHTGGWTKPPIN